VRDYAEVNHPTPSGAGNIDAGIAADALVLFGVDARGLDKVDRAILSALCKQFGGGPVGLTTLAISVSEQPETVEDVYEPFLIQQGYIMRTARGRVAARNAYLHFGLTPPAVEARPANLGLFEG
jgi:Holliday junction DNA helicase RuvB